jgi:hypothetical protein
MEIDIFELAKRALPSSWQLYRDGELHDESQELLYKVSLAKGMTRVHGQMERNGELGTHERAVAWLQDIAQLQLLDLEPMARRLVEDRFLNLRWSEGNSYHFDFLHTNGIDIVYVKCKSYSKMWSFLQEYLDLKYSMDTLSERWGIEPKDVLWKTK